jgi:hypothetical protein
MNELTASDQRRAAALLTHYAGGDIEGVRAIWDEAGESDCWPDLTAAVVALVFDLVPELISAGGVEMLRLLTRDCAAREQRDE